MQMNEMVENGLEVDNIGVWRLQGHENFGYSDGLASERYLSSVFNRATDLGSRSEELESHIKDWPSEYHLTRKRAQLLSGFQFDRKMRVLEVGCGCGAITRHLGENFDQVISVEGNINRARLARQRCRDLDSVSIICAPFQEIRFKERFDIIFCVGVFEYSGYFIKAADPYRAALAYFASMLSDNGVLFVAIENQFGLKYFLGAREDHLGTRFEGIEGYRRHPDRVRTFGKAELKSMIGEFFADLRFYYPFPDYKIPDCVLDEDFLLSGRAGEMLSQLESRDYSGTLGLLWDEMSTVLELDRNRALDFFANSFVVVAGRQHLAGVSFPQHSVMYSAGRVGGYSTLTRVESSADGKLRIIKCKSRPELPDPSPRLQFVEVASPWINSPSVLTEVLLRARDPQMPLSDLLAPAKLWVEHLRQCSRQTGERAMLDGGMLDAIWANAYARNLACTLIDQEWRWYQDLPLNVLVIRSIYDFLSRIETIALVPKALKTASGRATITAMAAVLDVTLTDRDFVDFADIESALANAVTGASERSQARQIRWFMIHRPSRRLARKLLPIAKSLANRVAARLAALW